MIQEYTRITGVCRVLARKALAEGLPTLRRSGGNHAIADWLKADSAGLFGAISVVNCCLKELGRHHDRQAKARDERPKPSGSEIYL